LPTLSLLFWQGPTLPPGTAAAATWREGDSVIITLDEAAAALAAHLDAEPGADVPGDTPILLSGTGLRPSAKEWRRALITSGLALRDDGGRRVVVARSDLRERRELLSTAASAAGASALPRGGSGRLTTGLVGVGGRILPAPYDVEIAAGEVRVNGVRVFPAPEIDRPLASPDAASRRRDEVIAGAARQYREDFDRAAVLDRLSAAPGLTGAEWINESRLRLDWQGEDPSYLELAPSREPEPPDPGAWLRVIEQYAATVRDLLAGDGVLLAGVGYCLQLPDAEAGPWRSRVEAILAAGEPVALTVVRLQAHTSHRDAALDLFLAAEGR